MYCVYICSVCSWDTRRAWEWRPIFIFDNSLCQCTTIHECGKWVEMIRMFLSCKLGTQTILEMYYLLHWHDHLNCLLVCISPYTLHSQSTFKTKVSLYTSPLFIQTLQAQMGKTVNARIKHFSNSFPVYRLPVHTNVDADAPVPRSFSILLYLALDWYWYSTQCLRLSTSKFSGTTRACTMWLYYTISTPAFRAPPLLLLMTIVNAHKNNLGWHGLRTQHIKWNQVSM